MIDVPEEKIERLDALLEATVELAPVAGGDHARNDIEGQDAVDGGAVAVNGEGDAKGEKLALGIAGPFAEFAQFK